MDTTYHQEYSKQHYQKNKGRYAASSKAWREKNKAKSNQHALDWYYRNREHAHAKAKVWRDAHKEHRLEYQRRYQKKNRAHLADRARNYWMNNPERRMVIAARKTAKSRCLSFDLTWQDITIPAVCPVLGIPIIKQRGSRTDNTPSLDRIIPEHGYVKGNVIIISWRANRLKQDASIDELRKLADFYQRISLKN